MATTTPTRPPARPKRNWAAKVTTTAKARPSAGVLIGVPGIGKSTMAAFIPSVIGIYDAQEDGWNTLKGNGLIPDIPLVKSSTFEETLEILDWLATGEHPHKAVAMDAMGGFERQCHEMVCNRDFDGDWGDKGFQGYMRGYDVALADWRKLLQALDRCRDRGMSVFILAHARIRSFKNPLGPDYDKWTADCHDKTWGLTHKWADIVLFANYDTAFKKGDEHKAKAKAFGGQARSLYTEHCAAFDAKNRHNLPGEIDMGTSGQQAWDNFVSALRAAKQPRKETQNAAQ
jgi:hypothetical protein